MSNKVWILNSLGKDSDYAWKVDVENYIKRTIELGDLVKLSYVNKEVQDFFRACIDEQLYKGEINTLEVQDFIKDYQSSSKILFVDENGCQERLLNFSKETTNFTLEDGINTDQDNWVDFGSAREVPREKELPKKLIKEKTNHWGLLFAILPYMYFIGNYSKKFTSVLTIAALWSLIILIYNVARKKANGLNFAMALIFLIMFVLRLVNPYWINSIAALFITLGICIVFLAGEFFGDGILSLYYKTSKRKKIDYNKFMILWLAVLSGILGSIIYFGRISFIMSSGWLLIAWIITSVNLKGCEVEENPIDEDIALDEDTSKKAEISEENKWSIDENNVEAESFKAEFAEDTQSEEIENLEDELVQK